MIQHYKNLIQASDYYSSNGFEYIDVPWLVEEEVSNITKPSHVENFHIKDKVLVASAEQSFLQLIVNNDLKPGKYQTITPCFRNEPILDDLHKQYFNKLELIQTDDVSVKNLMNIIDICKNFFDNHLSVDIISTDNEGLSYDIVYSKFGIELGSYGIRSTKFNNSQIDWIYATGLAEPRYSYVKKHQYNTPRKKKNNSL